MPGGNSEARNPFFVICITLAALMLTSCATYRSDMPSCSNVRGYYNPDIPLGAERLGSRLWIERRLIYTSHVFQAMGYLESFSGGDQRLLVASLNMTNVKKAPELEPKGLCGCGVGI